MTKPWEFSRIQYTETKPLREKMRQRILIQEVIYLIKTSRKIGDKNQKKKIVKKKKKQLRKPATTIIAFI